MLTRVHARARRRACALAHPPARLPLHAWRRLGLVKSLLRKSALQRVSMIMCTRRVCVTCQTYTVLYTYRSGVAAQDRMPVSAEDLAHRAQCRSNGCRRCGFVNADGWRSKVDFEVSSGSHNGSWALCCAPCSAVKPKFIGTQLSHVLRHAATDQHQKHAAGRRREALCLDAPRLEDFKKVYSEARSGSAGHKSIENVGKRRKIENMRFCLAESKRALDRRFLRTTTSIALMRDMRKSRLMIRYVAVNKKLKVRRGLLGIQRNFGHSAHDIVKATGRILRFAATICPDSQRPALDQNLLRHLRASVQMICADSAADEMLAAEMMRQPIVTGMAVLTPNLRVVLRDKAHASRRTLGEKANS